MANVYEPDFESPPHGVPAPFTRRQARVAAEAGARDLGATVYDLRPGEAICPLHTHHGNEELLIVLSGRPTLRTLDRERELEPGEVVAFPTGRAGAHRVDNHGEDPARVLIVSTMRYPEVVEYPDSDKLGLRTAAPDAPGAERLLFRRESAVDYFDGEA
jgi:uncharacterized cupin superfamily protein